VSQAGHLCGVHASDHEPCRLQRANHRRSVRGRPDGGARRRAGQSDAIVEGDEAFNVSLLSPIGATLGAQQREVDIIRDDD